ncbi:MAG: universal stress protein [bacterium]|nr:universal stress protein [bacterium]
MIFHPRKVLIPLDMSEVSPEVLKAGMEIANKWEAAVVALHVAPEPEYLLREMSELEKTQRIHETKIKEDEHQRLEDTLSGMLRKAEAGATAKAIVVWGGDPASDIVQFAGAGEFDLIVMGTHGRNGVSRMVIGSVAEKVIRTAPCPVFVIREKKPAPEGAAGVERGVTVH